MKKINYLKTLLCVAVSVALIGCSGTRYNRSTGQYIDDTAITAQLKAAIFNAPGLKATEINVETFKGVVQLGGFVNSQADINKAVEVTRGVSGVVGVKNDMRLK